MEKSSHSPHRPEEQQGEEIMMSKKETFWGLSTESRVLHYGAIKEAEGSITELARDHSLSIQKKGWLALFSWANC